MATAMTTRSGEKFDRKPFESLIKRRFFFAESFEVYRTAKDWDGDNRGLYDYGPPGCALQNNIVDAWRKHFVLEENMLEVDCPVITPEPVLKTSGHVAKFADWMCKDPVKGEYLRADHLVKGALEKRLEKGTRRPAVKSSPKLTPEEIAEYNDILAKLDDFDGEGLGELIKRLDIRNPNGDGEVQPPMQFNLMFKSSIGPSTAVPIYLRPETAQGQFLNFKRLLDFNQDAMPFASASIGKSYRNEISPRSGLLRVREFLMAEIEHFVDPRNKAHPRFQEVAGLELPLLDRDTQLSGSTVPRTVTLGEAVKTKLVDNETLGYFIGRILQFLLKIGVDKTKLRFRQHMPNEMAHYACDCWDAELLSSYGWIECVGCADRSAFDLTKHEEATEAKLTVKEPLPEPVKVEQWQATLNKKLVGPKFKKDAKTIESSVAALDQSALEKLAAELEAKATISVPTTAPLLDGKTTAVELTKEIVSIEKKSHMEHFREYTPNVIEPSFGIGRILYCLLEQTYWHRPQDAARGVLSLPLSTAPTKVLIVPLSNQPQFHPITRKLSARLRSLGISNNIDASTATIGKRYSRNDELGTPLGVTVDFDTVANGSITLRERDSTAQLRASEDDIVAAVKALVEGSETWEQVAARLPAFTGQGQDE